MSDHHLEDELLARLAEGETDPATAAHLGGCERCRGALRAYQQTAALLESYAPASRNLCPPRGETVPRAHLDACPLCREDLADLAALDAPPRAVLAVRLARGLVELVENALGELLPAPEPALARGGAAGAAVAVRRDLGGGATLEVSLAPGREGVDVLVRVTGAPRFRAELARAGRLVEGRESDERQRGAVAEDGRVLFDGVAPGEYELVVHRKDAAPVEVVLGVRSA